MGFVKENFKLNEQFGIDTQFITRFSRCKSKTLLGYCIDILQ